MKNKEEKVTEQATQQAACKTDPQVVAQRLDGIFMFDVKDGNPNGDPDNGNQPRIDVETGHGICSDVSVKRMIRDFVDMTCGNEDKLNIYMRSSINLNRLLVEAAVATGRLISAESKGATKEQVAKSAAYLVNKYFDIRVYGAVLSTGPNCGQVKGPVQITTSRSIDPIQTIDMSITRVAQSEDEGIVNKGEKKRKLTTLEDYKNYESNAAENTLRTMGRKSIVPYALYQGHLFVSACLAQQVNLTESDLNLMFDGLEYGYEHNRSASKGLMAHRVLILFRHIGTAAENAGRAQQAEKGCSHAHLLFERFAVAKKPGIEYPRKFQDYNVSYDTTGMKRITWNGQEVVEVVPGVILDPRSHINGVKFV